MLKAWGVKPSAHAVILEKIQKLDLSRKTTGGWVQINKLTGKKTGR
jgi:hypothetical protein